jgi:hypothetical protein
MVLVHRYTEKEVARCFVFDEIDVSQQALAPRHAP